MPTSFNGNGGFDSDFFAAYKHVYNPKRVQVLAYKNRPFFAKLAKKDMFEGDTYNHTVFFEDPQGGSATIATAIAQKAGHSQGARFVINRGREYQAITLQNEAIRASRSDNGALLRKKTHETDRILNEMCRRIDIAVHGSGTGVIASFTTGSSLNTTTITLDTPALGIRFSVGMFLQISTTNPLDGTAPTLVNGGQVVKVLARSVSAKLTTLTLDTSLSAVTGLTTTNKFYLLRNGEGLGFGANTPYGGVSGLRNWLPITDPVPGESFWGFDRSVDVQRLSGSRYVAGVGEKMEATLQNCSAEMCLQGATPDLILMNPISLSNYSQELGAKVRYMQTDKGVTGLDTSAMIVRGQSGDMVVMSDPQVDPQRFYMLQSDTWWMPTLDAVPHMDDAAGISASREATSDGIELRWRAWYNLVCDAPGLNLTGSFGY